MSRAGRGHTPKAGLPVLSDHDPTEMEAPLPEVPVAPPELPPEVARALAAQNVYALCKNQIIGRYPSLYPPEVIGAQIAEMMLWQLQQAVIMSAQQKARAQAEALGLAVPS